MSWTPYYTSMGRIVVDCRAPKYEDTGIANQQCAEPDGASDSDD